MMAAGRSWFFALGLSLAALPVPGGPGLAPAPGLAAQEVRESRILASVDFIAGSDLYLAVGRAHGVRTADTLPVYDGEGEGARLLGTFLIVSATERRSVARVVGEGFGVERGMILFLGVPADRIQAEEVEGAVPVEAARGEEPGPGEGGAREAPSRAEQSRFHGRVSLDYDAFRTTARWGEGAEGERDRTFSTPTFRLQARGRNLPGGFDLNTGMRISHRTSSDDLVQPVTSTRIYQLELARRFQAVPLEMHLGRFHSPFDEFSGFWDGVLLRVGPEAVGAGAAVGFEPRWSNEGFATDRPKAMAFVDVRARGERVGYAGAVSFLGVRPTDDLPDRTSVALSQRIRLGRAWVHQRLEVDRDPAGSGWDLTRLQVDASLGIAGGLEAFGGWRQWRYVPLWSPGGSLGPRQDRGHVGLSLFGRRGGASVDFSLDRREEGEGGRAVSGSFFLNRTPVSAVALGGSASYWTRGEASSTFVSPEVRVSLDRVTLRGAYRFYRSGNEGSRITTQFGDGSVTLPLGAGFSLRILGSMQWGGDLSSNRIFASVWKAF